MNPEPKTDAAESLVENTGEETTLQLDTRELDSSSAEDQACASEQWPDSLDKEKPRSELLMVALAAAIGFDLGATPKGHSGAGGKSKTQVLQASASAGSLLPSKRNTAPRMPSRFLPYALGAPFPDAPATMCGISTLLAVRRAAWEKSGLVDSGLVDSTLVRKGSK
ncbi:unnamed protein product [Polarella glacialis]|nr:unnamed protein product [Polarella glacialis]